MCVFLIRLCPIHIDFAYHLCTVYVRLIAIFAFSDVVVVVVDDVGCLFVVLYSLTLTRQTEFEFM